jgi:hypothetical protein
VSSKGWNRLDKESDDSDESEEREDELSSCGVNATACVMVSALGRVAKRPKTRGWVFQARMVD